MVTAKKPATTEALLKLIAADPMGIREALADADVVDALEEVGVAHDPDSVIRALHAPGPKAKTQTGFGVTLCDAKGTRHANVTCKKCLKKQAKQAKGDGS